MPLIDPDHPFFRPPWRRWATVLAPGGWAIFELVTGSPGWAMLFGAAGGYAFWVLILGRRGAG
ncbi:MAG: hypothetical protein CVT84_10055 [Alphaproteobacteria bacterium HGW-Alphaproteobacteria-6]|nr:MAG: hypothetical protein CVT84_10055 [Alphaproteobacteria bacterium HGW-Alphaproteobacteria-6]